MKKDINYVIRQTSPVVTIGRQIEPFCIITFDAGGTLLAFTNVGILEEPQKQAVIAEAWRFAQTSNKQLI